MGGVAEAAEHAGDVAEGRLLGAAVGEGAGGLAFEVDDEEVGAVDWVRRSWPRW